jgi:hypothetical protein
VKDQICPGLSPSPLGSLPLSASLPYGSLPPALSSLNGSLPTVLYRFVPDGSLPTTMPIPVRFSTDGSLPLRTRRFSTDYDAHPCTVLYRWFSTTPHCYYM